MICSTDYQLVFLCHRERGEAERGNLMFSLCYHHIHFGRYIGGPPPPVLKVQTVPMVVPPGLTSSIRQ